MTLREHTSPKIDRDELRRARNAFSLSVVTAILFSLILVETLIAIQSFTTEMLSVSTLAAAAVISVISARLSRRGKSGLGILVLIGGIIIIVASRVFVQKGPAIPTGVTNIILICAIAVYTLPQKWIGHAS